MPHYNKVCLLILITFIINHLILKYYLTKQLQCSNTLAIKHSLIFNRRKLVFLGMVLFIQMKINIQAVRRITFLSKSSTTTLLLSYFYRFASNTNASPSHDYLSTTTIRTVLKNNQRRSCRLVNFGGPLYLLIQF